MRTLNTASKTPFVSFDDWYSYCRRTRHAPPSDLARSSLALIKRSRPNPHVLELGPGSCRDSRFFLENGAELVTGVDASPVVRPYASALAHDFSGRFVFHPVLFGDFDFGEKYDLIFALYSLQYHGIEGFEELVERVLGSLAPGGVFAATFIGADHFMKRIWTDVAFSSKQDIDRRLESLRIENIHEQRDMEYDVGFEGLVNHFVVTARKP